MAPGQRPPAGRRSSSAASHRSKTRRRKQELMPMTTSFPLPVPGDACVRGEWFAAASLGDQLEGRVHGGQPSGVITPFFTASSMPLLSSEEGSSSLLGDMKTTYLNSDSPLLEDDTLRLNRYLAAAKLMLMLHRQQVPPDTDTAMASNDTGDDDHDLSPKKLLGKAMSSLAMEFCHLRIWRDHHRLMGVSPMSIWESVRRSCRDSSSSSSHSWSSSSASFTGSTSGSSSSGLLSALFEDMSVRSDKAFRRMDLDPIDREVLSTLNDIAGVMIQGGYEDMLRRAIDRYSAQLASYLEILDINNILGGHKEESKEILLKVWTTVMHIIVGFLSGLQRKLNGQDLGYFNIFKEDYFLAIAKESIRKLLRAADSMCIQVQGAPTGPVYMDTCTALKPDLSKMVNLVMMYQALSCSMPPMLALLSGQTKESTLAECEGLIHRLSEMFVKLSVEQIDLVIARCLDISDTGVHPFTRRIMDHVRMLVQLKSTVCLMLKGDLKAFHQLVVQLISSLESMLDRNSKGLQLLGQQQIFLLNNVHFMLQEAKIEKELESILGEGWMLQRNDQLDMFIAGYVDTSWTPVISCVLRRTRVEKILWPAHQLFAKFTSLFETTYRVHKTWKVTNLLIRNKVREAIFHKVIPVYRMRMEHYSEKQQKSARYNIEQLESQLQELFEG